MSKDYTLNQAFNFYFLDAYLIDDPTILNQYESKSLESQENEQPSGRPEELKAKKKICRMGNEKM